MPVLLERLATALSGPPVHRAAVQLADQFFNGEISLKEAYERIEDLAREETFDTDDLRDEFDRVVESTAQTLSPFGR